YVEAEPLIREGLEIHRKLLGNAHYLTFGTTMHLAELLYAKSDYQGAEDAAREALNICNLTLPQGNIDFAVPLTQLGLILTKTGRAPEGEKYLRQALAIRSGVLPAGHQLIATTEGALGECLNTQKRFAEAEPFLLRSFAATKSN